MENDLDRRLQFRPAAAPVVVACLLLGAVSPAAALAQVTVTPYSSFGFGDGWLSPGESGLGSPTTAGTERGLACGTINRLYMVSRAGAENNVYILNATTGVRTGQFNMDDVSGGTFAVNMIATAGSTTYVCNLTVDSTASPFKVYLMGDELFPPLVVYSGDGGLPGCRIGDSLACTPQGMPRRLAAGYGATPNIPGNNGYAILAPPTGSMLNATAVSFGAPAPLAGDHRLGITFVDATHVIGTQGMSRYRYSSFAGTGGAGTLLASPPVVGASPNGFDRPMAYAVVGGRPLLAIQSTSDAHVSFFDVTIPSTPVFITSANNTSGALAVNTNLTGALSWRVVNNSTSVLYAMSTNQGIQAFTVTVASASACSPADIGIQGGTPGHDNALDNNDFVVFIDSFFTQNARADLGIQGGNPGHDGLFDNNDFVVFIDFFFDGCV